MSDKDAGEGGGSSEARAAAVCNIEALMRRKEEIEAQIKAYYDVLESQKGVGMNEPLVDREGYPRADVDLYQVRTARHNIICLQNDHKAVMKQVEEALHQLHARDKEKQARDMAEAHREAMSQRLGSTENSTAPQAFAKVNSVSPGSPASLAKPLNVTVIRSGGKHQLRLVPTRWAGKGLLGCNIIPLQR
uniref:26S proteasome non-ATPase regulatory subunit 9 isoform X2 n=1 Tax=Jaculus jaculus TaxID=51337 RepID=UPI001E1B0100|nr:26S proteasome non-ATPase regulatory subunit 9 isoform X2 [Jaculus jaculus]